MLREMLSELLYELEVNDHLPITVNYLTFSDNIITMGVTWGNWIEGKSVSKTEIKAVTFHELTVTKTEDEEWYGRVIFDI
jgi:SHS2 domain-containing protein